MTELLDLATARDAVVRSVSPLGTTELELGDALGRVLAEEVRSHGDLPPFRSSAMDGYAVQAGPGRDLRVVGESRAGHPAPGRLGAGEAIVISTGAEAPDGEDVAVVPLERVERLTDRLVRVPDTDPGANVRRAGEDVRAGEAVLRPGTVLGPPELAVAAAVGRARLTCGARPRVAVIVTGDELVEPGRPLGPGQVRDSNAIALAAQSAAAGAQVTARELVPDDRGATVAAIRGALEAADLLCLSGGVSVGPHDHVKPALAELGVEERFWGVRLKPGKPTWFGVRGRVPVFGLPGNPVSAMVTFHLLCRPAVLRLAGADPDETRTTAVLDAPVRRRPGRDEALRCRLSARPDGWHVEPTKEQGSHILTSMLGARALALVPAGEGELPPGAPVEVELLGAW